MCDKRQNENNEDEMRQQILDCILSRPVASIIQKKSFRLSGRKGKAYKGTSDALYENRICKPFSNRMGV